MAASVQVLCPNGRRQNIKITPSTKLLQVLEEACKRQGFVPPEDYILMHGRKQLDLSLSLRFAGLPNNVKLDLVKSSVSRLEEDIMIALQLENGNRLQGSFTPSQTLWQILMDFENKSSEYKGELIKPSTSQTEAQQPVCIFMQDQIIGESALRATTLKKLGLTSGRAIIRLLHRPVEENVMASITEKVEKEKDKQKRLEEIAVRKQQESSKEIPSSDSLSSSNHQRTGPSQNTSEKESFNQDQRMEISSIPSDNEMPVVPNVSEISENSRVEEHMDDDSSEASNQSKSGSISKKNPTQASGTSSAIDDLRNLNIPGVEIFTPDDFSDLSPQEQLLAQRLARRFLPQLQAAQTSTDPSQVFANQISAPDTNFVNFKFPESTKGQDLSSTHAGRASENQQPCERQCVIYNATETLDPSGQLDEEEIPEDFFEVTQEDVRKLYYDLQKNVQNLEDQPLMTKAMREMHTQALCDRYELVVIRVHFPDKQVLQGFFKPRETVKAIHTFVRDCLQDRKLLFYLYTTPPRTVLKNMNSTLVDSDLIPAAHVYFGTEVIKESYLKDELKQQTVSRLEAERLVLKIRPFNSDRLNEPPQSPQPGSSGTQRRTPPVRTSATASMSTTSSSRSHGASDVPKWLKLSKK